MGQIVTSDLVKSVGKGLKTIFQQGYAGYTPLWDKIASRVDSDLPVETYAWLGSSPSMREFKDERQAQGLSEYSYQITNKKFEATIGVAREALEDEQYGQINLRVKQLAGKARVHYDRLVADALANVFTTLCYDGQYMVDTDHQEGASGVQSNKGTSALSSTTFAAARAAMAAFKDDKGELVGAQGNLLVVPPALEGTARQILNAELINGGETNVWRGTAELLVLPWLTDSNDWFLIDTNQVVKPILLQIRKEIEFGSLEADSDTGFMRDTFYYGVRARHNVGYGDWRGIYGAQV